MNIAGGTSFTFSRNAAAPHARVGAVGADVQRERHVDVLRGRPEAVVVARTERCPRRRRHGDQRAGEPEVAAADQLAGGVVDVVDVDHRDALEAAVVLAAELGEPVVVGLHRRAHDFGVGHRVQHEALARIDHRTPHAVGLALVDVTDAGRTPRGAPRRSWPRCASLSGSLSKRTPVWMPRNDIVL